MSAEHVALEARGGDGQIAFGGILLGVILALGAVSPALATSSTSSELFVGASQKAKFRLIVNATPQARLVVRFTSLSMRRRIRNERFAVAYCSWGRLGASVNPINLRRNTAVAELFLNHPKTARPSVCGVRSVSKRVKTRNGTFEYLEFVSARMRHISS